MTDQKEGRDAWEEEINFFAHDPMSGAVGYFKTLEEAEEYCRDCCSDLEWMPEEYIRGELIMGKVLKRSGLSVTETKDSYETPDDWPHDPDFAWVGYIEMLEV